MSAIVDRIQAARKALADVSFEIVNTIGVDAIIAGPPRSPIAQLVVSLSKAQDQLRRAEKRAGRIVVPERREHDHPRE